jgi:hypothetical protein
VEVPPVCFLSTGGPWTRTAKEAVAWTFDLGPADYKPLAQT